MRWRSWKVAFDRRTSSPPAPKQSTKKNQRRARARSNPATRKKTRSGSSTGPPGTVTKRGGPLGNHEPRGIRTRARSPFVSTSTLSRRFSSGVRKSPRVCFASSLARRRLDFASGDSESPPIARETPPPREPLPPRASSISCASFAPIRTANGNANRPPRRFVSSRVFRMITSRRSRASRVWFGVRPDRGCPRSPRATRRRRSGWFSRVPFASGTDPSADRAPSSPPKRSSARSARRSDADGTRRRRRRASSSPCWTRPTPRDSTTFDRARRPP